MTGKIETKQAETPKSPSKSKPKPLEKKLKTFESRSKESKQKENKREEDIKPLQVDDKVVEKDVNHEKVRTYTEYKEYNVISILSTRSIMLSLY